MNELNLNPILLEKRKTKSVLNKNVVYIGIILVSLLFFGIYFPQLRLNQLQQEELGLKQQVDSQSNILNKSKEMQGFINDTNQLAQKIDSFERNRALTYGIITSLQKYSLADINFTSMAYTSEGIMISASAKNYDSAAIFVANLQESDVFKTAKLTNISISQDGIFTFNVSIKRGNEVSVK